MLRELQGSKPTELTWEPTYHMPYAIVVSVSHGWNFVFHADAPQFIYVTDGFNFIIFHACYLDYINTFYKCDWL